MLQEPDIWIAGILGGIYVLVAICLILFFMMR